MSRDQSKAWIAAVAWAIAIFCTVPLARTVQREVDATVGRGAFTVIVLLSGLVAVVVAIRAIRRAKVAWTGYVWLAASAAAYTAYTLGLDASPEESFHFVEYGVLGLLLFRALGRGRDVDLTVYGTAFLLGASVGVVDEGIQWLIPERVWDLRDIGLNAFGVALVLVPLAFGIRPAHVKRTVTRRGLLTFTRAYFLFLALLGPCLLNTPARITWYASRVPGLGYLLENESLMIQYGYLYDDPEIGRFRSRFDPEALAKTDRERAVEAAKILDQYKEGVDYGPFLKIYTARKDPFLHEARVHLFRRNHYIRASLPLTAGDPKRRENFGIVVRENQILEKYFPETLARTASVLPRDQLAKFRAEATLDDDYESPVSLALFTRISERSVWVGLVIAVLVGFALRRHALVALAALLLVGCASPPTSRSAEPSLDLVFFTDVHARTEYETPAALELAAKRINAERPELVIAGGDLATDGFQSTPDVVAPRWRAYLAMLEEIEAPVRHVIGNHDLVAADPDDGSPPAKDPRAIWREKTGEPNGYFSFDFGGYHFVFLDAIDVGGPLRFRGHVSDEQLAWLDEDLAKVPRGTPIVAATHMPLLTTFYAATEGSTVSAPLNRVVGNNREVLARFEGHDLVLVLQGHLHASEAIVWRGITFITGGALSAKWWRGPWFGTEEGFTVVKLRGRRVEWRYVDIGWESKRKD